MKYFGGKIFDFVLDFSRGLRILLNIFFVVRFLEICFRFKIKINCGGNGYFWIQKRYMCFFWEGGGLVLPLGILQMASFATPSFFFKIEVTSLSTPSWGDQLLGLIHFAIL